LLPGNNSDDFVSDNKAAFSNLPSGLTAKVIRVSDTTLIAYLEGNADNHTMNDNSDSLVPTLNNSAISNNDTSAIEFPVVKFMLLFQSPFAINGADSYPGANGIYPLEGFYNEKPYYRRNNYYLKTK
jgi:hypothetical protein